jgi:16S rRNA (guanine966-N2)-methyltransferase
MKDRVREAVFNLIGPSVAGTQVLDLFAGTGALGLEALSRGATRATLIERHLGTTKLIRENAESLDVAEQCQIVHADTFFWVPRNWPEHEPVEPDRPWLVFCSPPYDFYIERAADMLALLAELIDRAPAESIFVVESDQRFDPQHLPTPPAWKTRGYPPARIALGRILH